MATPMLTDFALAASTVFGADVDALPVGAAGLLTGGGVWFVLRLVFRYQSDFTNRYGDELRRSVAENAELRGQLAGEREDKARLQGKVIVQEAQLAVLTDRVEGLERRALPPGMRRRTDVAQPGEQRRADDPPALGPATDAVAPPEPQEGPP